MTDLFNNIVESPPDVILNTAILFRKDPFEKKVNLGVGAYRDENNKPVVFESVRKAEEILMSQKLDHEYLPIEGNATLIRRSQEILFGLNDPALIHDSIVSCQGLSGSGSLRILGDFIYKFFPKTIVYVTDPTWSNHIQIFNAAGLEVRKIPYWDAKNFRFAHETFISHLESAPVGSVILLHACAHNPTGMDPTHEQWKEIASTMKAGGLIPFFDVAYQGFASGCLETDAWSLRYFRTIFSQMYVAQSFAKNMGMYGERCGVMHIVCNHKDEAIRVMSQLKICIRSNYSSPPLYGARLVSTVLSTPELYDSWTKELAAISGRIQRIRKDLMVRLEKRLGCPEGTWKHINEQIGMFSFTGLSPKQCNILIEKYHIYLLTNGRISLAGLNEKDLDYVVESFAQVIETIDE